MKVITVNGKVYKLGRSTWHSYYSSLFISFDGGLSFTTEYVCVREWEGIASDPDHLSAYKQLWV